VPEPASFIRWFKDLGLTDVPLVGGKNASLGELYRELASAGVQVPNGFAITAEAYRDFMRRTGLADTVTTMLRGLEVSNLADLAARGLAIRQAMTAADLPTTRLVVESETHAARQLLGSGT
jgi:pyruvate,water dikinase